MMPRRRLFQKTAPPLGDLNSVVLPLPWESLEPAEKLKCAIHQFLKQKALHAKCRARFRLFREHTRDAFYPRIMKRAEDVIQVETQYDENKLGTLIARFQQGTVTTAESARLDDYYVQLQVTDEQEVVDAELDDSMEAMYFGTPLAIQLVIARVLTMVAGAVGSD